MKTVAIAVNPNSATVLAGLLRGIGRSIDPAIPFPRTSIEEQIVAGNRHGVLPWLLAEIAARGSDRSLELGLVYQRLANLILTAQIEGWRQAREQLSNHNVRCALFKGILYASDIIRPGERSIANDVDILIEKQSVETARKCLKELGFSQNVVSHDGVVQIITDEAIATFEETHYELFPFTKILRAPALGVDEVAAIHTLGLSHPFIIEGIDVFIAVELDVHHALSIGIESEDVWNNVIRNTVHDDHVEHLSWETQVWFVAARLYHEVMILGATKLRPLIELGRIIERHNIVWGHVIGISKKYSLGPGIYYVLSFISDTLDVGIPDDVLGELDEQRLKDGRLHDFGDFVLKALGESVLLRPKVEFSDDVEVSP